MFLSSFTKKVMRNGLISLVVASSVFAVPSCTVEEQAIAGGILAGVITGAAIIAGPTCHGGYRTVCESYVDYWGYVHTGCHEVYDSCAYYRGINPGVSVQAEQFANKYNLSMEAGQKVVSALEQAATGDLAALKLIGLTAENITTVTQMQTPTQESLVQSAQTLNIAPATVHAMVSDVVAQSKAQLKDVGSAYWTSCMGKTGSWKTDKNILCKQTFWNGCTPETGASYCISK